ncbi:DUF2303 family protein [Streptomyces sp. DSM 44917]|uniref:DUF2303 family protein n=1 Tax=Streptomyces boetiae TaxID=3075541 RepID=A0ABU2L5J9_9ACTN|nr:DUF2303 family protein [Streptomyces sp. DSM 44917]MDT0306846.1 DUF2303 family protein [Streptomyces sp. DSM 44917]
MTDTSLQPVIDTATRAAEPHQLQPGGYYIVNTPAGVREIDLTGDQYKDAPTRKTGTTTVRDVAGFTTYYGKHADDATEVYADAERLTVTAVLDAHRADAPRWAGHRLTLALRTTDAWRQWLAKDGELSGQEEFAEFIEDHLPELLEPTAAEMLEIAQSIQGATKAEFQSSTRLVSGQRQFQFVETTTAKAGQKGQLTVPETFTIGLVPFEGSEGYRVSARFRYRLGRDGALSLGYKLERPGDILRTAFADVVTAIGEQITQPVMNGTPA